MFQPKTKLHIAVNAVLFSTLAFNPNSTVQAKESANKPEDRIIITGSRISRTEAEGAATVVSMTTEEMQQQGFTTLYDALSSFTSQTGSFYGELETNGFQPNAQAVNFRGLGPGRTLYLLDGRRIADYPSPYNGSSNFTNLAQIPLAIVERVEVMAGGASAIYGSDAMAGVVNIITKKNLDGATIAARKGQTEQGGGDTSRFQWFGGSQNRNVNTLWAIEYYDADPIMGSDRQELGYRNDNLALVHYDYYDANSGQFIPSLGTNQAQCDTLGFQFVNAPALNGGYCTNHSDPDRSLRNDRERLNLFTRLSFEQGDYNELFLELHLWDIKAKSSSGPLFWSTQRDAVIVDNATDLNIIDYVNLSRSLPEINSPWTVHNEEGVDMHLGFKGVLSSTHDYEIVLAHSYQSSQDSQLRIKEEVAAQHFLGNLVFSTSGYDVYTNTNLNNFYQPLTANDIDALTGLNEDDKFSSVTSLSFNLTGDLFRFYDDYVQFATILEVAQKKYEIDLHARTLNHNGQGWFGLTGTEGEGTRDRYAFGIETLWPLGDAVNLTLAGRYDHYDDETKVGGAFTYNLGLEYRPTDELLIRSTATSNFRAPDMHYVYAGQGGFYLNVYDPQEEDGMDSDGDGSIVDQNEIVSIFGYSVGNKNLKEETGHTYSLGFVYEPVDNLSFSMDWYEIEVEDLVADINVGELLLGESVCLTDPNILSAAICNDINSRIDRVNGTLQAVHINPINTAYSKQRGVDSSLRYSFTTDSLGSWFINANHTVVLESERQLTSFSNRYDNWRNSRANNDLRSRFRSSITWLMGDWRTTLMSNRIGSVNSATGGERLDSWTTYNFTTSYAFTENFSVDLIINNVTREYPRIEGGQWPYFNTAHYNATRKETFLEARYEF